MSPQQLRPWSWKSSQKPSSLAALSSDPSPESRRSFREDSNINHHHHHNNTQQMNQWIRISGDPRALFMKYIPRCFCNSFCGDFGAAGLPNRTIASNGVILALHTSTGAGVAEIQFELQKKATFLFGWLSAGRLCLGTYVRPHKGSICRPIKALLTDSQYCSYAKSQPN